MADWARVKWSEARQILDVLGDPGGPPDPEAGQPPAVYFEHLRTRHRQVEAVKFLGQALPRLEAVAWAARIVRDLTPADADRERPEARALKTALLWVADPTEARRRAAGDAAEACDPASPERFAALAAFFSGGSIAPPDCAALPAPRDAAGRFASGAVLLATSGQAEMEQALSAALDSGAQIAESGLETAAA